MPEATGLHAGLSSRLADSHVSSPQIHEDEGHMDALHVLIQKVSTMYPRPSMPLTLSWMTNASFWILIAFSKTRRMVEGIQSQPQCWK